MKKTLVALAVLAASGASFAQVTITGKLGYGAQRNPTNATVAAPTADSAQGLLMTDGDVKFTAMEDLGGGMKVTASSELRLRGRDDTVAARNATIGLTTSFGQITLGSYEATAYHLAGFAGAPVELAYNADGNSSSGAVTVIGGRSNIDAVSLTAPVGPVMLTALYGESAGGAGNATGVTFGLVRAQYAAGPLVVGGDYTGFMTKDSAAAKPLFNGRDRYRAFATYDFGMAKVGVGYQNMTKSQPDEMNLGVTVPMGAVVFGLTYANRAEQKADASIGQAAAKARDFTGMGVQYNFSKMTNLNLSYGTFTGIANYSDEYRIRLLKNF